MVKLDKKLVNAENEFNKLLKYYQSSNDIIEIKNKIHASKEGLKKERINNATIDPEILDQINNLRNEIIQLLQNKTEILTTIIRKTDDDYLNIEHAIIINTINHVQKIISLGDAAYEVYYNSPKMNDTESIIFLLPEIVIEEINEEVKKIEDYEVNIYNMIIFVINSINGYVKDTIYTRKFKNGRYITVDAYEWRIKYVQSLIQEMTKRFEVETSLTSCIEKFNYGMFEIIQMYDYILNAYEKIQFADYIAAINSEIKPISSDIDKLEKVIKSNLVLQEYEKAIGAFKQYIFPFADKYLGQFDSNYTTNNVDGLIDKVRMEITSITNMIEQNKYNENINPHISNLKLPFHTRRGQEHFSYGNMIYIKKKYLNYYKEQK